MEQGIKALYTHLIYSEGQIEFWYRNQTDYKVHHCCEHWSVKKLTQTSRGSSFYRIKITLPKVFNHIA